MSGKFSLTSLYPYVGMPHYRPQGHSIKIQTLLNMIILYIIQTEI